MVAQLEREGLPAQDRAVHPHRAPLRALRQRAGADRVGPVVREHEAPGRARDRGGARGQTCASCPSASAKVYYHWMENVRDWPISRQLWWGHRIPVWYCDNGHRFASAAEPER